jgi:MYXO-CTERM domain-containing protein
MKKMSSQRMATLAVACLLLAATTAPAGEATWSGGDAAWDAAGAWGGSDSTAVFGNASQIDGDDVANITDGSTVTGNSGGDSNFKAGDTSASVLNISGGSTLLLDSVDVLDGAWNKADGDITLDNGTINRTKSGTSVSGGFFMLGSWGAKSAVPISMSLDNGSMFSNDGVVAFGMSNDSPALTAILTIAGGSTVDLTGGAATDPNDFPDGIDNGGLPVTNDLVFVNNFGDSNTYHINFTGPGTLITDNGISIATQEVPDTFTETFPSYEELWDAGILQANGGNAGVFADHFSVSGTPGGTDYTLTSTVPEPTSLILAAMALVGLAVLRRRR